MIKMKAELVKENKILWDAINDTFWMAIRYADGRHTFSPHTIREHVAKLKEIGYRLRDDIHVVKPPEGRQAEYTCMNMPSDWLHDIFDDCDTSYENESEEYYDRMSAIINKIYIARNITLNKNKVIEQLKSIDKLGKEMQE